MPKIIILIIIVPVLCSGQEFNFTQEWNTIPVSFNGVECQLPWTTGYNYINPTFCDIDGDDDFDLFIGSDWARLTYFINNGNQDQFEFEFISDYLVDPPSGFAPLSQRACIPIFCDIDNDGDFDLFYSAWLDEPVWYGKLYYYLNIGTNQNAIFLHQDSTFQGIESPAEIYPFFIDIDNDGDYDLFTGYGHMSPSVAGKIGFYLNEGTSDSASMILHSEQFMGIDLGDYAIPSFCDIDNDGDLDMFLGDGSGQIHFYRNDGNPEIYNFTEVPGAYGGVNVANIASPSFCDIDGDGDFDLFVGERSWGQDNRRGDINYYQNVGLPDSAVFEFITQNFLSVDIGKISPPAFADLNIDGLVEMFLGDGDGNINYFSNSGTENAPYFTFETETFQNLTANYQSRPTFGDLDNDGDLDLIAGRTSFNTGSIQLYQNDGTPEEPEYTLLSSNYLGINYDTPAPKLLDIDNDGDLDLFVGHFWGQVVWWKNIGSPLNPNFVEEDTNFLNTPYEANYCLLTFGDLDHDGDYDAIRGSVSSQLSFYRNIGSPETPHMVLEEEQIVEMDTILSVDPFLIDIDNDGDLDLFVGDWCGGVSFFRNLEFNSVSDQHVNQPTTFTLYQNYPNPFNATTVIPFTLDRKIPVKVTVYNQLGQNVITLFDGIMNSGMHQVNWDAGSVSSGVYLIRLDTQAGYSESRKVMLVK